MGKENVVNGGAVPDVSIMGESELLESVRKSWAEVLDIADPAVVPLDTNFLEAGGSSLLLIMLWEELHGLTNRTIKVSDLFVHSSVRSQAELLAGTSSPSPATAGAEQRRKLLGRVQRG